MGLTDRRQITAEEWKEPRTNRGRTPVLALTNQRRRSNTPSQSASSQKIVIADTLQHHGEYTSKTQWQKLAPPSHPLCPCLFYEAARAASIPYERWKNLPVPSRYKDGTKESTRRAIPLVFLARKRGSPRAAVTTDANLLFLQLFWIRALGGYVNFSETLSTLPIHLLLC